MVEMDIYNESVHEPEYTQGLGYDNVDGIASIHNEAAAAAPSVKMFTNEYNIFQDSYNPVGGAYQAFNNWYLNEVATIRNNGGNVGGVGAQYYPNTTIGSGNNQHSAARMYAVWQNLATHGLPMSLTEFGVKSGGEAIAPTVLDDSMRLTFGTPSTTGFVMWGFWNSEGLFAPGSAMYDANWNITETGKRWQDLLGIVDWDGNPNNAWDTNVATTVNADGTISFTGFHGDYYLRGQTSGAFDATLTKGTSNYNINMAAPPTWSLWNASNSGQLERGGQLDDRRHRQQRRSNGVLRPGRDGAHGQRRFAAHARHDRVQQRRRRVLLDQWQQPDHAPGLRQRQRPSRRDLRRRRHAHDQRAAAPGRRHHDNGRIRRRSAHDLRTCAPRPRRSPRTARARWRRTTCGRRNFTWRRETCAYSGTAPGAAPATSTV